MSKIAPHLTIKVPDISVPKIPDVSVPKIPDIDIPKIPDVSVPKIPDTPTTTFSFPRVPDSPFTPTTAINSPSSIRSQAVRQYEFEVDSFINDKIRINSLKADVDVNPNLTASQKQQIFKDLDVIEKTPPRLSNITRGEMRNVDFTYRQFSGDRMTSIKDMFTKHWGKILVAGASVTMITIAIAAQLRTDKVNNTDYTITNIQQDPQNPSLINIRYTPEDAFTPKDTVIISSSNSKPIIDNLYSTIYRPLPGSFAIKGKLESPGNYGKFKVKSEFSDQLADGVKSVVEPITSAAGSVVTTTVGAASDTVVGSLGAILDSLIPGFGAFFSSFWWLFMIFSLFSSVMSSFSAMYVLSKKLDRL